MQERADAMDPRAAPTSTVKNLAPPLAARATIAAQATFATAAQAPAMAAGTTTAAAHATSAAAAKAPAMASQAMPSRAALAPHMAAQAHGMAAQAAPTWAAKAAATAAATAAAQAAPPAFGSAAEAECEKTMVAAVAESRKAFAGQLFGSEPADNNVCSTHWAGQAHCMQALLEPLLSDPHDSPLRPRKLKQPMPETEAVWQSLRGSPGQTWRVRNDCKVTQMVVRTGAMPSEPILCHMVRGDMFTQASLLHVVLSGQGDTKILRMPILPSGWITVAIRGVQNYEFVEICNMAHASDLFVRQHSHELLPGCRTDEDEWCLMAPFTVAEAAFQADSGFAADPRGSHACPLRSRFWQVPVNYEAVEAGGTVKPDAIASAAGKRTADLVFAPTNCIGSSLGEPSATANDVDKYGQSQKRPRLVLRPRPCVPPIQQNPREAGQAKPLAKRMPAPCKPAQLLQLSSAFPPAPPASTVTPPAMGSSSSSVLLSECEVCYDYCLV